MIQAFHTQISSTNSLLSFTTLEQILIYLSMGLKNKHFDYIILQLFKTSNNLLLLDYSLIFNIFSIESIDYRSPSPSPTRKNTTFTDDSSQNKRKIFKFRTGIDENTEQNQNKLKINSKYLFFGQGFINDRFKTFYINNLIFNENEEINGNFFYNNDFFPIKGEFQTLIKALKFSAFPLNLTESKEKMENSKKIEFDGKLLNNSALIQGTLKIGSLEEDLTLQIVIKIWKFEGKYTNNKNNYEFSGFLAFKANNLIEGKGVDALGEYSWRGMMQRDLQIKLVKSYKDNTRFVFEGMVQREMVVGHYEFEEEEGEFSMKYEEIL